ncbi:MAG: Rqc2 family fibronectin-binding protein [Bacillota bacterium]|jgi:predicted ribosome quality control (RQC) complex YloA/Tae2 family protein
MHIDGFFFNALAAEIHNKIQGSRVEDVYDSQQGIILQFRAPGHTLRLEIAIPPRTFYLTSEGRRARTAGAFSQTLKKHMATLFCTSFTNTPFDRRATLALAASPDSSPGYFLHLEAMGRQNDLILCQQERIILSTRPYKPGALRPLQPGDNYSPPEMPAKALPHGLTASMLQLLLANQGNSPCEQALVRSVMGVSPLLAREICFRANAAAARCQDITPQACSLLAQEIANLSAASLRGDCQPALYSEQGPYWMQLTHLPAPSLQFDTLSAALCHWQLQFHASSHFRRQYQRLRKALDAATSRTQGALQKQYIELQRALNFEHFRQVADTILASLPQIPKGADHITLPNIYTGEFLDIPLDPALSPSANATRYYKRYSKYKNAAAKVQEQIAANESHLAYIQSLDYALEAAQNLEDLQEVLAEAEESGIIRRQRKSAPPPVPGDNYLKYRTDLGTIVLVGRNNRQNERLTLHKADKNHFWFHSRHSPGSHVILCTSNPAESELNYAAGLAAWHSKERASAKVEVVWTQVKNVKKIPRGKPGMVQYTNFQSMLIEPIPH